MDNFFFQYNIKSVHKFCILRHADYMGIQTIKLFDFLAHPSSSPNPQVLLIVVQNDISILQSYLLLLLLSYGQLGFSRMLQNLTIL